MARFIGTPEEFYKLFGTTLLTKAVESYTKEYREMTGCQHKGAGKCSQTLQSAHIHDNGDRKKVAMTVLEKYKDANGNVDVDMDSFLEDFYKAHKPLHKTIRVLCSTHHGDYDKGTRERNSSPADTIFGMPRIKPTSAGYTISYFPDEDSVLDMLKKQGYCYMHYVLAGEAPHDVVTKKWINPKTLITHENLKSNLQTKTFVRKYRNRIIEIVASTEEMPQDNL